MTPRSRKILTAVSATLLLVPALVFAANAANRSSRAAVAPTGAIAKRIIAKLELTPDQVAQIKAILKSHKTEVEGELKAVKDARLNLFDTIHADQFNEQAIRGASADVADAEAELAVTRGEIVQEVRAVLTPEQQAKAKELVDDFKSRVEDFIDMIKARLAALGL